MELFSDLSFFLWLIALSIPAVILGILEKPLKYYGFCVTLVFLWLAMGASPAALMYLAGFCVFEFLLAKIYLALRRKFGRKAGIYRLCLVLSIAPLAANKILALTENPYHILSFLGISYMTFKAAQIIIEIYDGVIQEVRGFDFFYLMLFFPSVLSGPIDRSRRFGEDINRVIPRAEYLELVGEGLFRIFLGLLYKVVIAALFYTAMTRLGMRSNIGSALIYMYSYGFYLFFDFAGYSHMAIGTSYLFGVRMPENFRAPFVSKDIKEFWDRWHITLSHWFRDFIFSRVTMLMIKHKVFRNKLATASTAFMINMTVMGFWHGITPSYILYGVYHGVLLSLTEVFQKKSKFYKKHKKDRAFQLVSWFVTFQLVMFGFFIFSGRFLELLARLF